MDVDKKEMQGQPANERKWRKMKNKWMLKDIEKKLRPNQMDIDAKRKSNDWLFFPALAKKMRFRLILFVYWFYHWNTYITQTMVQSIERMSLDSVCSTNYGHFSFSFFRSYHHHYRFFFVLHAPIKNTANVIRFIDWPNFFFVRPHWLASFNCSFCSSCYDCTNKYFLKKIIGLKKKKMENKKIKKNSLVVVEIVVSFSLFFLSFDVHK